MQIMERLSWLYQPQDFSAHPVIYKTSFMQWILLLPNCEIIIKKNAKKQSSLQQEIVNN